MEQQQVADTTPDEVTHTLLSYLDGALGYQLRTPVVLDAGRDLARGWTVGNFARMIASDPKFRSPNMRGEALRFVTTQLDQNPMLSTKAIAHSLGMGPFNSPLGGPVAAADKANFDVGWQVGKRLGEKVTQDSGAIELAKQFFSPEGKGIAVPVVKAAKGTKISPEGITWSKPGTRDLYNGVVQALRNGNRKIPPSIAPDVCGLQRPEIIAAEQDLPRITSLLAEGKKNNNMALRDFARTPLSQARELLDFYLAAFENGNYAETIKRCSPEDQKRFEDLIGKLKELQRDTAKALGERSADNTPKPAQARRDALLRAAPVAGVSADERVPLRQGFIG